MEFLKVALLCLNIIVAILLIGAVLLQKSEGGALGMGGGPSNFMSARGTGDLLTRITWILFSIFLAISIGLFVISAASRPAPVGANIKIDPDSIKSAPADLLNTPPAGPTSSDAPAAPLNVPASQIPSDLLSTPAPATAPATAPEKK